MISPETTTTYDLPQAVINVSKHYDPDPGQKNKIDISIFNKAFPSHDFYLKMNEIINEGDIPKFMELARSYGFNYSDPAEILHGLTRPGSRSRSLQKYIQDSRLAGDTEKIKKALLLLGNEYAYRIDHTDDRTKLYVSIPAVSIPHHIRSPLPYGPFVLEFNYLRQEKEFSLPKAYPTPQTPMYSREDQHYKYIHPHIDKMGLTGSAICMGDELGVAQSHLRKMDLLSTVNSVMNVLLTYNAADPYIKVNSYKYPGTAYQCPQCKKGARRKSLRNSPEKYLCDCIPDPSFDISMRIPRKDRYHSYGDVNGKPFQNQITNPRDSAASLYEAAGFPGHALLAAFLTTIGYCGIFCTVKGVVQSVNASRFQNDLALHSGCQVLTAELSELKNKATVISREELIASAQAIVDKIVKMYSIPTDLFPDLETAGVRYSSSYASRTVTGDIISLDRFKELMAPENTFTQTDPEEHDYESEEDEEDEEDEDDYDDEPEPDYDDDDDEERA